MDKESLKDKINTQQIENNQEELKDNQQQQHMLQQSIITGILYDKQMELHQDYANKHPEKPDRMRVIINNIKKKKIDTTKYAQKQYNLERIAIVDWDVHFGDGSVNLLKEEKKNVLFFSLHRYDEGSFYPQNKKGNFDYVGENENQGYRLNIPWNTDEWSTNNNDKPGDNEYINAFEKIILPILKEYNPQLTFISCGFDAAINDPLGGCKLTREGYAYMTRRIQQVTNGKIIVVLEGGYDLDSISACSESIIRTLLGEKFPLKNFQTKNTEEMLKINSIPNSVGEQAVQNCLSVFKKYWSCLDQIVIQDPDVVERCKSKYVHLHEGLKIKKDTILIPIKYKFHKQFYQETLKQYSQLQFFTPQMLYIITENVSQEQEKNEEQEYLVFRNLQYEMENPYFIRMELNQQKFNIIECIIRTQIGDIKHKLLLERANNQNQKEEEKQQQQEQKQSQQIQMTKSNTNLLKQFFICSDSYSKQQRQNEIKAIDSCCEFLQKSIDFFEQQKQLIFKKPELILFFDRKKNIFEVNFINLHELTILKNQEKQEQQQSSNSTAQNQKIISSIISIIQVLEDFKNNYQKPEEKFEQLLEQLKLDKNFKEDVSIMCLEQYYEDQNQEQ